MKSINFKNKLELIKTILTNPKVIKAEALVAGGLLIGGQQLKAQELLGLKPMLLNPVTNANGLSVHNRTYSFDNLNTPFEGNNTLWSTMEARYGADLRPIDSAHTSNGVRYNVGIEVGSNNLQINKTPVSDKLYEQVHMVLVLSKVLNTPINMKLAYSQKINQWVCQDASLMGNINVGKETTGATIVFKGGKIISYDGIQEIKFGNIYAATLRVRGYPHNPKMDTYYQLMGCVELNKNKSFKFTPYVGVSGTKSRINQKNLDYNFSVIFKPKGKFSAYAEVGFNKSGKWTWLSKASYQINNGKSKLILKDTLKQELNKDQKAKQDRIRSKEVNKNEVSSRKFNLFKPRNKLSSRAR